MVHSTLLRLQFCHSICLHLFYFVNLLFTITLHCICFSVNRLHITVNWIFLYEMPKSMQMYIIILLFGLKLSSSLNERPGVYLSPPLIGSNTNLFSIFSNFAINMLDIIKL